MSTPGQSGAASLGFYKYRHRRAAPDFGSANLKNPRYQIRGGAA